MRALRVTSAHAADCLVNEVKRVGVRPTWCLVYGDQSASLEAVRALSRANPGVPIAGCTSYRGVFAADGFKRGFVVLMAEPDDDITVAAQLVPCRSGEGQAAARRACAAIQAELGGRPDLILMHATPGFEEEVLEGIDASFDNQVPVVGGSAADDEITGGWSIFLGDRVIRSGVVLIGLRSPGKIRSSFVGGYLPSGLRAIVTKASGRVVHELDGEPAAQVYNRWTDGAIARQLREGGRVLRETTLLPLARTIEHAGVMPRRLLSHPESVSAETGSITFFSRFNVGEEVLLMTGTSGGLIPRAYRAVERALEGGPAPKGGLLVYCAGSLSATLESANDVAREIERAAGNVPFIGISTFGEQGNFFSKGRNHHGNLMCSALILR